MDEYIKVDDEHRMLICQKCKTALRPDTFAKHFRQIHKLTGSILQDIINHHIGRDVVDPVYSELPRDGSAVIRWLPVSRGFSCIKCRFLTVAPDNIVRHWRQARHGTAETRWEEVTLQTWMGGRYVRYWIVRDDGDTSITPDSADVIRRSTMEEIIASSQARLKEEDAVRLRKGDLEEDIDRDSSWVRRLRWVRHFGSRDLLSIHDAATWVRGRAITGNRAGQADEQAIREQVLLGRLGQSFDREVDRCCWRLDSVPTETLQWLASITATSPSGVPFGKKGKEASMTKYRSVGHRYLSFCWRSYRIGREEALERWAVRFTDEQWSLLHDVDEELQEDAFPSSRDSGFCSGRNTDTDDDEEDEEVSECDEEFDDGGISSPVYNALDRAIFRTWYQATSANIDVLPTQTGH
ncbi:hypothetical protein FOYG_16934 [Fusarium oxysporum NRRL 32931]|uniref:C2H2-type domain-containing protein n=1 Tax=Fusarium oxysporum NRRL 32931 TaxID=660029 RepID=W9HGA5_FUSOX|nr:hypothetical protein FOYG_16934 [Fusarium oxysporum NRRL 32931]